MACHCKEIEPLVETWLKKYHANFFSEAEMEIKELLIRSTILDMHAKEISKLSRRLKNEASKKLARHLGKTNASVQRKR